jgi:hypothetical protein
MKKGKLGTFVAIFALPLLVAVLLAAVNIDGAMADERVERPFRMQTYGYVVEEGPDVGDCSFETVIAEDHGVATHMGAVSLSGTHCFSPFNNPPIYDGEWQAEGADGSKVYGAYEASMTFTEFDANGVPIRGKINGQFTITGGTGRFQGATGGGTVSADYDLVADAGHFLREGTITY